MRDRAKATWSSRRSTASSRSGWRGARAKHWERYEIAYLDAWPASRLRWSLSVHTVVSFDFAVSVIPGLARDALPALLRRGRGLLRVLRWC